MNVSKHVRLSVSALCLFLSGCGEEDAGVGGVESASAMSNLNFSDPALKGEADAARLETLMAGASLPAVLFLDPSETTDDALVRAELELMQETERLGVSSMLLDLKNPRHLHYMLVRLYHEGITPETDPAQFHLLAAVLEGRLPQYTSFEQLKANASGCDDSGMMNLNRQIARSSTSATWSSFAGATCPTTSTKLSSYWYTYPVGNLSKLTKVGYKSASSTSGGTVQTAAVQVVTSPSTSLYQSTTGQMVVNGASATMYERTYGGYSTSLSIAYPIDRNMVSEIADGKIRGCLDRSTELGGYQDCDFCTHQANEQCLRTSTQNVPYVPLSMSYEVTLSGGTLPVYNGVRVKAQFSYTASGSNKACGPVERTFSPGTSDTGELQPYINEDGNLTIVIPEFYGNWENPSKNDFKTNGNAVWLSGPYSSECYIQSTATPAWLTVTLNLINDGAVVSGYEVNGFIGSSASGVTCTESAYEFCDNTPFEFRTGCLAGETLLRLDSGESISLQGLINEMRETDSGPLMPDGMTEQSLKPISAVSGDDEEIVVLEDEGGHSLKASLTHPMLTPQGPVPASWLQPGEQVLTEDGLLRLTRVERQWVKTRTYGITLARQDGSMPDPRDASFVANGFVVGDFQMQNRIEEAVDSNPYGVQQLSRVQWAQVFRRAGLLK